jgi:hypothetical protein
MATYHETHLRCTVTYYGFLSPHAGRGLQECAGLIPVAIGLKFVGLAIMGYIFAALVAAGNIGHAGRSGSAAVIVPSDSSPLVGSCYDFYGRSTSCWWVGGCCFGTGYCMSI